MARFCKLVLGGVLCLVLSGIVGAQTPNPDYVFSLTSGVGSPATVVEIQMLADNTGDNIDGWSFGVCSDPGQVLVSYVDNGPVIDAMNNGSGPFFHFVDVTVDGWSVGLIVN